MTPQCKAQHLSSLCGLPFKYDVSCSDNQSDFTKTPVINLRLAESTEPYILILE